MTFKSIDPEPIKTYLFEVMSSGIGLNDASGAANSGRGRNYMGGRLAKPADRDHMIQTEVLNIENRFIFVFFHFGCLTFWSS